MTELMQKAIAKIDAEAEESYNSMKYMAQWIIENLIFDDNSAKKILDESKKLVLCYDDIYNYAKEKKEPYKDPQTGKSVPGVFFYQPTPDEVTNIIRKYYGIFESAKKSNIIDIDLADML